ncbi:MAG: hypothetical protein KBG28_14300, partial [Kofleriaceae bacterium]|nr:hypothetical protein [Kofleriaceae bacterium]
MLSKLTSKTGPLLLALTALTTATACDQTSVSRQVQLALDGEDPVAIERTMAPYWLERAPGAIDEIEAALDEALRAGYGADPSTADGSAALTRTALVEWARRVRRELGDGLATAVPALREDPGCAGSLIGDQALIDYVDAVTARQARVHQAVGALTHLGRHLTCIGELQSLRLAWAMRTAFLDVEVGLRQNQLAEIVPMLALAVSSPMLLVHDVERRHGDDTPLARWFVEYADLLREGAVWRHHPAAWHGLWLYDRHLGRLRGLRVVTEGTSDDNTIDLGALIETMSKPGADDTRCSLIEMVGRGTVFGRYACLATACEQGLADPELCKAEADGGGGGDSGGGGAGVDVPGLATDDVLACLSAQAAGPMREQFTCIREATGSAAAPRGMARKDFASVGMAGARVGGQCDLTSTARDVFDAAMDAAERQYQADL